MRYRNTSDNYMYISIYLYILCSCVVRGKKRREGKKAKLSTASYNLAQQLPFSPQRPRIAHFKGISGVD